LYILSLEEFRECVTIYSLGWRFSVYSKKKAEEEFRECVTIYSLGWRFSVYSKKKAEEV